MIRQAIKLTRERMDKHTNHMQAKWIASLQRLKKNKTKELHRKLSIRNGKTPGKVQKDTLIFPLGPNENAKEAERARQTAVASAQKWLFCMLTTAVSWLFWGILKSQEYSNR